MSFSKAKHRILMVGPDSNGLGGISRVVRIWEKSGLLNQHGLQYFPSTTDRPHFRHFLTIWSFLRFLNALFLGAEFVYIHTSVTRSFYRKSLFVLGALLGGSKVVLHIHPSEFRQFLAGLRGFTKVFVKKLLDRVHVFVVLTQGMHDYMVERFPKARVFILTNPVDLQGLSGRKSYPRDGKTILYLGWFIKEKGVYDLVDAMAILAGQDADAHLEFYGTKEIAKLKEYVKEKSLGDRVFVNGWVSGMGKLEALHSATMLVLPSHTEGIPNVILEAMATRTPIVSTGVGGMGEILVDGGNAIIAEPKNPKDLSEKILSCLRDQQMRERISNNAYEYALANHDIRIIKEHFSKMIEELNNQRHS